MNNRLVRRAVATAAVSLLTLTVTGVGIVGATGLQVQPSCAGSVGFEFPDWGYMQSFDGSIYSHTGRVSLTMDAAVPAGTYDVATATYDGNEHRDTQVAQRFEQLFIEFLDGSGTVIAATSPTGDLADLVTEASWSGPVGQVELDRDAVAIRAYHAAEGDYSTTNSLMPVCVGLEPVVVVTTTTTTSTTMPVESSSATTPDPVAQTPSSTTLAPATTAPPTTTVPVHVLGIQESEPAVPVRATPRFTG